MSNRFLCNFNYDGDYSSSWPLSNRFLGQSSAWVKAYYFFYCAQPLSTSASIQNIRTNLREYYVKRLKINLCMYVPSGSTGYIGYIMVFVLNVPDNYVPSRALSDLRLSELPNHTIPECVLYYDLYKGIRTTPAYRTADIRIDIKKPFKVLPSHKLVFVYYLYSDDAASVKSEGTAEVFFEVN